MVAFVAGLGELFLITTKHTLRRWGRALKITAPLMVGFVAILASIGPLKAGDLFVVLIVSGALAVSIYRMENDDRPWLKPTE